MESNSQYVLLQNCFVLANNLRRTPNRKGTCPATDQPLERVPLCPTAFQSRSPLPLQKERGRRSGWRLPLLIRKTLSNSNARVVTTCSSEVPVPETSPFPPLSRELHSILHPWNVCLCIQLKVDICLSSRCVQSLDATVAYPAERGPLRDSHFVYHYGSTKIPTYTIIYCAYAGGSAWERLRRSIEKQLHRRRSQGTATVVKTTAYTTVTKFGSHAVAPL